MAAKRKPERATKDEFDSIRLYDDNKTSFRHHRVIKALREDVSTKKEHSRKKNGNYIEFIINYKFIT